MKIGIVGSRNFPKENLVRQIVKNIDSSQIIVSGGAKGVDSWAVDEARKNKIVTKELLADWEEWSFYAGPERNTRLVQECDAIIAFWDGRSKGTRDVIQKAREAGKLLFLFVRSK